jgi:uncharacterized protein YmfQ (DUF2313 family)
VPPNADALKLLLPVTLAGDFPADLELEGKHLDSAQTRAEDLLQESFANSAYDLLARWESVYGLPVSPDDPLQVRQDRVLQKMRELGRLDRAYFIQMAAAYGFTVWIDELHPLMAGWGYCGDELGDDDSDWCWRVWVVDSNGYFFRAGESCAGECLSYSYDQFLLDLLNELKPAHTFVEIIWA